MAPVDCESREAEAPSTDGLSALQDKVDLGRIAFESPALLGGAAARMGLSCSSCHINGRGNPDFFVEGVSGAPGTADVTSSLFSKVRGNGAFDPVVIPDLSARDGTQIRDRKSQAFRDKVRGLIVEEFDGQPPPSYVFEAVLVYLDSLDVRHCTEPGARATIDFLDDYTAVVSAAVLVSQGAATPEVKLFYIRAARERLERMHERYPASRDVLTGLEALSQEFAAAADAIRAGGQPRPFSSDRVLRLAAPLVRGVNGSLYNADTLRAALLR
jgi:hypothetical protein